jgi:hypothetical protein
MERDIKGPPLHNTQDSGGSLYTRFLLVFRNFPRSDGKFGRAEVLFLSAPRFPSEFDSHAARKLQTADWDLGSADMVLRNCLYPYRVCQKIEDVEIVGQSMHIKFIGEDVCY